MAGRTLQDEQKPGDGDTEEARPATQETCLPVQDLMSVLNIPPKWLHPGEEMPW